MKAILGRKMGMTEVFAEDGTMYAVTVVEVVPNVVTQVKTQEHDGYVAVQVGLDEKKESRANKPEKGHAKKAGTTPFYHLRELRGDEMTGYNLGDTIKVDMFKAGDFVDVTGTAIGKGYAGPIKLNNQHRGPMGHGSKYHRGVGSMGAIAPNRVYKGKRMPSHMGNWTRTVQNLTVVEVIAEKNLILVKGNVPGPKKGLVFVKSSLKKSA